MQSNRETLQLEDKKCIALPLHLGEYQRCHIQPCKQTKRNNHLCWWYLHSKLNYVIKHQHIKAIKKVLPGTVHYFKYLTAESTFGSLNFE